jgi:dTMP kinase
LFAADRADHLTRLIEPALARGGVVLTDRYYHSSLAYQSLDVDLAEVRALNRSFRVPDLTLFLEVPPESALARIAKRGGEREIFEHRAELERVAASYRTVIDALRAEGQEIATIDALLPADDVEARAWALLSSNVI